MTRSRFPLGILVMVTVRAPELVQRHSNTDTLSSSTSCCEAEAGGNQEWHCHWRRLKRGHCISGKPISGLFFFFFFPSDGAELWTNSSWLNRANTFISWRHRPKRCATSCFPGECFRNIQLGILKFPFIVTLQSSLKDGWGESGSWSGRADFRRLTACLAFSVTHRDPWPLHPDPAPLKKEVWRLKFTDPKLKTIRYCAGQWLNHSGKRNTDFSYKSIFWDSTTHRWLIPKAKQCN